jgi:lipoprotein
MKKLNYLLVALFSFLVIGCNRSDEMPPQPQDKLIGSWGLTKTRLKGNMIIFGINTPIDMDAPITPCEKKTKTTFLPGGTGTTEVWANLSGSCQKKRDGNITYTFDKDTKELVVHLGGETTRSIVKKLTSTELEAEESVTNLQVMGITFTGTVYVTMKKNN